MKYLITAFLLLTASVVNATTITYFLDNVIQNNNSVITGTFDWTYTEGDFEGGSGVFTELFIVDDPYPLNELTTTIETKSIEITLIGNIDSEGVDIQLKFADNGFTELGGDLDLTTSQWSLRGGGISGTFTSGAVTPTVVPIPPAVWLFGSGLLGLVTVARRKHK